MDFDEFGNPIDPMHANPMFADSASAPVQVGQTPDQSFPQEPSSFFDHLPQDPSQPAMFADPSAPMAPEPADYSAPVPQSPGASFDQLGEQLRGVGQQVVGAIPSQEGFQGWQDQAAVVNEEAAQAAQAEAAARGDYILARGDADDHMPAVPIATGNRKVDARNNADYTQKMLEYNQRQIAKKAAREGRTLEEQQQVDAMVNDGQADYQKQLNEINRAANDAEELAHAESKRVAAEHVAAIRSEVETYKNMRVSQGDALRSLGKAGGAAMGLALFGEAFMGAKYGIKTGATAAYNSWMDRELDSQKANINHQQGVIGEYKNLYDMARQTSADEEQARAKFKLMKLAEVEGEMKVKMYGYQSKQALVDFNKAQRAIGQMSDDLYREMEGTVQQQEFGLRNAANQAAVQRERAIAARAAAARQSKAVGGALEQFQAATTPEERTKASLALTAAAGGNKAYKGVADQAGQIVEEEAKARVEAAKAAGDVVPIIHDGQVIATMHPGIDTTIAKEATERIMYAEEVNRMTKRATELLDKYGVDTAGRLIGVLRDEDQIELKQSLDFIYSRYATMQSGANIPANEKDLYNSITNGNWDKLNRADVVAQVMRFGREINEDANTRINSTVVRPNGSPPIRLDPKMDAFYHTRLSAKEAVRSDAQQGTGMALSEGNASRVNETRYVRTMKAGGDGPVPKAGSGDEEYPNLQWSEYRSLSTDIPDVFDLVAGKPATWAVTNPGAEQPIEAQAEAARMAKVYVEQRAIAAANPGKPEGKAAAARAAEADAGMRALATSGKDVAPYATFARTAATLAAGEALNPDPDNPYKGMGAAKAKKIIAQLDPGRLGVSFNRLTGVGAPEPDDEPVSKPTTEPYRRIQK